jgi:hypothetical protein
MNDAWTGRPDAPAAVLLGDAAGWTDPITGQGLSNALRDARLVAEAARADTSSPTFGVGTGARRADAPAAALLRAAHRPLRRLTPSVRAGRHAWEAMWPDDPVLSGPQLGNLVGADRMPAESCTQATVDRVHEILRPAADLAPAREGRGPVLRVAAAPGGSVKRCSGAGLRRRGRGRAARGGRSELTAKCQAFSEAKRYPKQRPAEKRAGDLRRHLA